MNGGSDEAKGRDTPVGNAAQCGMARCDPVIGVQLLASPGLLSACLSHSPKICKNMSDRRNLGERHEVEVGNIRIGKPRVRAIHLPGASYIMHEV